MYIMVLKQLVAVLIIHCIFLVVVGQRLYTCGGAKIILPETVLIEVAVYWHLQVQLVACMS